MNAIASLRVRDKRLLFVLMRNCDSLSVNTFFPWQGFTAGEFAVGHILTDHVRKTRHGEEDFLEEEDVYSDLESVE